MRMRGLHVQVQKSGSARLSWWRNSRHAHCTLTLAYKVNYTLGFRRRSLSYSLHWFRLKSRGTQSLQTDRIHHELQPCLFFVPLNKSALCLFPVSRTPQNPHEGGVWEPLHSSAPHRLRVEQKNKVAIAGWLCGWIVDFVRRFPPFFGSSLMWRSDWRSRWDSLLQCCIKTRADYQQKSHDRAQHRGKAFN